MPHFGIICPSAGGHLNTMLPVGQELQRRGHRVTLIGVPITQIGFQTQAKTLAAGLEFQAVWQSNSAQSFAMTNSHNITQPFGFLTQLGKRKDIEALRTRIGWIPSQISMYQKKYLTYAPEVIRSAGIEALLIDSEASAGGTIAQYLNLPFINIYSAVISLSEVTIPPYNTAWHYDPSWWGIVRNQVGYALLNQANKSVLTVINSYRQEWNLPRLSSFEDNYSSLAQISQQPAELEFPRQHLPKHFHFTGPYHYSGSQEIISFPYEKLTGQPLIYASLGSLLGGLQWVLEIIAQACKALDVQLVISRGGRNDCDSLSELSENILVVDNAPQLKLLQKAALTITHGGINTVLESLYNGVPMVVIPLFRDQYGMAARVSWTGAGKLVPLRKLSMQHLHATLKEVLDENSYKKNAVRLQEAIKRSGGVEQAADIIEQAIATGKPVLAR